MKRLPTLLAVICALAALGLGGWAWQEHQQVALLRAAALDSSERSSLQKRIWDAEKRARELEARLLAVESAAKSSIEASDPPAASSAPSPRGAASGGRVAGASIPEVLAFLNNPETLRTLNQKFREQVDTRYAALFKALNLPPAQLGQLKELLAERQAATVDVAGATLSQGLKPNTDELRQLVSGAQADTDRKLAAVLGATGYAQFEAYENAQLFRGATNSLQQGLTRISAPLSDEQSEQFTTGIATLAQNSFNPAQQQALRQLTQLQQTRDALQQVEQLYRDSKKPPAAKK